MDVQRRAGSLPRSGPNDAGCRPPGSASRRTAPRNSPARPRRSNRSSLVTAPPGGGAAAMGGDLFDLPAKFDFLGQQRVSGPPIVCAFVGKPHAVLACKLARQGRAALHECSWSPPWSGQESARGAGPVPGSRPAAPTSSGRARGPSAPGPRRWIPARRRSRSSAGVEAAVEDGAHRRHQRRAAGQEDPVDAGRAPGSASASASSTAVSIGASSGAIQPSNSRARDRRPSMRDRAGLEAELGRVLAPTAPPSAARPSGRAGSRSSRPASRPGGRSSPARRPRGPGARISRMSRLARIRASWSQRAKAE